MAIVTVIDGINLPENVADGKYLFSDGLKAAGLSLHWIEEKAGGLAEKALAERSFMVAGFDGPGDTGQTAVLMAAPIFRHLSWLYSGAGT